MAAPAASSPRGPSHELGPTYRSYFLNHDSGAVLLGQNFTGSHGLARYIAHSGGASDTRGNPTITP
jgi:hypothetical protein